ncbi:unnamed protein product [Psylliodes chrysocephalus]|uniref:Uncharacterized protein n=1 Tax=Psylliodes chrysocephalus TaxID=3402493 RepID=A0A9P0D1T1_9CUCU|nr:unnamed protein product [Psylliodes chrysocephala]
MDLRDGKKVGAGEDIEIVEEVIVGKAQREESIEKEDTIMSMFAMMMSRFEEKEEKAREDMEKIMHKFEEKEEKAREDMEKIMHKFEEKEEKYKKDREELGIKMDMLVVEVGKVSNKVEDIGKRLDDTKTELRQEIESIKVETDRKLEQNKKDIREEVISRIDEIETVQDDKIKKFVGIEVNGKLVEVQEMVDLNNKRVDEIVKGIEDRVQVIKDIGDRSIGCVQVGKMENRFDGNIFKIHPKVFVKIVKNKIRNLKSIDDIKEYIREAIDKDVVVWFSSREREFRTYEDFEKSFLECYWGEVVQSNVRENLYFGKFDDKKNMKYSQYALQLFNIAQYLDPPMREEEIIRYIARHFKFEITETIILQNIKDMNMLNKYLSRIEQGLGNNLWERNWYSGRVERRGIEYNELVENQNRFTPGQGYYNRNYRNRGDYRNEMGRSTNYQERGDRDRTSGSQWRNNPREKNVRMNSIQVTGVEERNRGQNDLQDQRGEEYFLGNGEQN